MDIRFNPYNPIHICKAAINYLMKRYDNNDIFGAPSMKDTFKGANHIGYSKGGLVSIGEHHSMSMIHNPWGKGDEVRMGKRHVCLDCGHEDRVEGYFVEVISCPKCSGLYVDTFKKIHYQGLLRPDKTKEEITAYCKGCGYKVKGTKDFLDRFICPECKRGSDVPKKPLLSIVLDDINSVPTVHYKGEEVTHKMRLMLDWKTDNDLGVYPTYILIEHHDTGINTKTIQHNDPFGSHV
ncbi:hypothetical protein [Bacillus sp. ISL-57]|uniref:hypothetical protein n=1 Tax=Bacillus sp. ISL-57 TaxID=2819135 RepID=UPI001BEAF0C6|nr:hypothetical protein [Bacillus sp. ISL-57]MBT2718281.1 hypothetical protein [Bacillus sp. ISL-57]